jgi:hypothetical protein
MQARGCRRGANTYVAEGDSGRVMQRPHGSGVTQVSYKGLQMGQKKLKERQAMGMGLAEGAQRRRDGKGRGGEVEGGRLQREAGRR